MDVEQADALAETLAVGERVDLTVLLKAPEERGLITDALRAIPGATIVSGPELAGIAEDFDEVLRSVEVAGLASKVAALRARFVIKDESAADD